MLKNCKICGREYDKTNRSQLCDDCREINRIEVHKLACKRWGNKNRKRLADYARAYYQDENEKNKHKIRTKTYRNIKKGLLKKCPCAVCGSTEVEAHHINYDDELSSYCVIWLCMDCHKRLHHDAKTKKDN